MESRGYREVWRKLQSGDFDIASQRARSLAAKSEGQPSEAIFAAFADYVQAYREFEYTYRYSEIEKRYIGPALEKLKVVRSLPAEVAAVRHLLEFLRTEINCNRANDCVDPGAWVTAARQALVELRAGLDSVKRALGSPAWDTGEMPELLHGLEHWFETSECYYKAIAAYAHHLREIRSIEWERSGRERDELFELLKVSAGELEEHQDQDSASEIRAYLYFSQRIAEATAGKGHIHLRGVQVAWLFPFKLRLPDIRRLFVEMEKVQEENGNVSIDAGALRIHPGRLVDILDTSYGKATFDHAMILEGTTESIEVQVSGLDLSCDVVLFLYRSSDIAVLKISTTIPQSLEVDVLRARLLLGLAYPGLSGEYVVRINGETSPHIRNVRDAAWNIAARLYPLLRRVASISDEVDGGDDGQGLEPLHDKDWFSYLSVDRILLDATTVSSFGQIKSHPELKALCYPVREAHASHYDWVAYEGEPMQNLAQIMSHTDDVFFLGGNQAFIYLRDDPLWTALEYRHTLDQVFMLKGWVIELHEKVDRALARAAKIERGTTGIPHKRLLSEQIEDLHRSLEEIASVRRETISIANVVANSAVSLYPDHGVLLKRIHAIREVPELLGLLEKKTQSLGESESSILSVLRTREEERREGEEKQQEQIERRREAEVRKLEGAARFVQTVLATIGVLIIITTALELLKLKDPFPPIFLRLLGQGNLVAIPSHDYFREIGLYLVMAFSLLGLSALCYLSYVLGAWVFQGWRKRHADSRSSATD